MLDNFSKIYDSVVVIVDGNWLLMPDTFKAWEWSEFRGWNVFIGFRKVQFMVFAKCERDALPSLVSLVSSPVDDGL
jgi:hypothetical protein